jgi:hypothetical protein
MTFEDEYLEVLNHIESRIISLYRSKPSLQEEEILEALSALYSIYRAEEDKFPLPNLKLSPKAQEIYEGIQPLCEWHLGRGETPFKTKEKDKFLLNKTLSLSEVKACLKKIEKSVKRWRKEHGSQGYLKFVSRFVK